MESRDKKIIAWVVVIVLAGVAMVVALELGGVFTVEVGGAGGTDEPSNPSDKIDEAPAPDNELTELPADRKPRRPAPEIITEPPPEESGEPE